MWIRVTVWQTVTPSAVAHSSGQKKLFFHLLDLAILNSYILHSSCGGKKISHTDFRFTLVRNMLAHVGPEWRVTWPLGRPANVESHIASLEVCGSKHWTIPSETQLSYHVFKARGVTQKVYVKCHKCEVGLCVKQHILKITTLRHSSNIRCDLLKKEWGLKPICK